LERLFTVKHAARLRLDDIDGSRACPCHRQRDRLGDNYIGASSDRYDQYSPLTHLNESPYVFVSHFVGNQSALSFIRGERPGMP
jgi:hypothetical protein